MWNRFIWFRLGSSSSDFIKGWEVLEVLIKNECSIDMHIHKWLFVSLVYSATLSELHRLYGNEWEMTPWLRPTDWLRMWKQAFITYFNMLSLRLFWRTENNHHMSQFKQSLSKNSYLIPLKSEGGVSKTVL